ncbi:acetyltransferase [Shewanella sp. MBTL60-007]|uniref:acetyltransferase n=1 Tax=Shewanella sp. MBTL60-007 TaxID=2815911 RepID=UPI001BC4AAA1|nr:acetyltransferase [Shewanella sp. MBTL60-007]GIU32407.1 transferase [Shewanella sp. MBTL60-007]
MSSPSLYIVGAGGLARELYSYLSSSNFIYEGYELKGFLDDNQEALNGFNMEHKVLGPLRHHRIEANSLLLMGVASCQLKQDLFSFYRGLGASFITFSHPSSFVGRNVTIGEGSILGPNAVITTDVKIGLLSTINANTSIGHDASLGDFCTLSGHCDITGGVELGDRVFLGSHACIIPRVIIESDSIIGAGSVVIKRVVAGSTMFGNPAKKIK